MNVGIVLRALGVAILTTIVAYFFAFYFSGDCASTMGTIDCPKCDMCGAKAEVLYGMSAFVFIFSLFFSILLFGLKKEK